MDISVVLLDIWWFFCVFTWFGVVILKILERNMVEYGYNCPNTWKTGFFMGAKRVFFRPKIIGNYDLEIYHK